MFYYKRVPKDWKANSFHLLKANPKIAIRLTEILVHYLGNDESKGTKYIFIQVNLKKVIVFKNGKNYIENFAKGNTKKKISYFTVIYF